MRILLAANKDTGLYKFRRELLERLLQEHEVFISLPDGDYVRTMVEMGCRFEKCEFDRHGTNPVKELQQVSYYKRLIGKIRPDIVLTYTIKPNVYCGMACAGLKVPYVANITGLGTAVENGGLMQKATLLLYRRGLRKAQKVFFQNTENRDFMLRKGIVSGEYGLLPGSGVNLSQYTVLDYPDGDTVDFAFIARVMKEKGIDQYLEAAKAIREKYPMTRFHVCGMCEQDYEDQLTKLQEEGIIIYHGMVKDVAEIHKISSCTVHPTYYPEGLSNVLLESCACGRPIITTNRSGCREVVEDGVNGFIVREKDSADLIAQIEKFLSLTPDQKREMGLRGREKVEREFDRQIVVDAYMKEIQAAVR